MPSITTQAGIIDVQGLVNQLMAVEKNVLIPVQKRSNENTQQLSGLGQLKSDLSVLQNSLRDMRSGTLLSSYKVSSANDGVVSGSANTFASPGVYQVEVLELAQAQSIVFSEQNTNQDSFNNAESTLNFVFKDGSTSSVKIKANATLEDIRRTVNEAKIGLTAMIVKTRVPDLGNPDKFTYQLAFSTTAPGQDKGVQSISCGAPELNFLNRFDVKNEAKDAKVKVNGLELSTSNNLIDDNLPGVKLNLFKVGNAVVTVTQDKEAIEKKIQTFIDGYNKVLETIDRLRERHIDKEKGTISGIFKGDVSLIMMKSELNQIISSPIEGLDLTKTLASLAQIGVSQSAVSSTQAGGKATLNGLLKFDKKTFDEMMGKRAEEVVNVFDKVAVKLSNKINELLAPNGILETKKASVDQSVRDTQMQLEKLENRLNAKRESYIKQYAALDSTLTGRQGQSSYILHHLTNRKSR